MTKKDYIIISRVFHTTAKIWTDARAKWWEKARKTDDEDIAADATAKIDGINKIIASMEVIVKGLSHELLKDNPKFDAQKFTAACGLPKIQPQERVHKAVAAGLDEHRHEWGAPHEDGVRWCQGCEATIDTAGGIIN
mgnify:CR=1 FL=1